MAKSTTVTEDNHSWGSLVLPVLHTKLRKNGETPPRPHQESQPCQLGQTTKHALRTSQNVIFEPY